VALLLCCLQMNGEIANLLLEAAPMRQFVLNLSRRPNSQLSLCFTSDRRLDRTVDSLAHRVDEDTAIPDY